MVENDPAGDDEEELLVVVIFVWVVVVITSSLSIVVAVFVYCSEEVCDMAWEPWAMIELMLSIWRFLLGWEVFFGYMLVSLPRPF